MAEFEEDVSAAGVSATGEIISGGAAAAGDAAGEETTADVSLIIARTDELKREGNDFLAANRYVLAAERYTVAIELRPTAILYSNRAQALIKLESYGLAISDANEAIK